MTTSLTHGGFTVATLGIVLGAGIWYNFYLEEHRQKVELSKKLKETVDALCTLMNEESTTAIDSECPLLDKRFEYIVYKLEDDPNLSMDEQAYFKHLKQMPNVVCFDSISKGNRRVHLSYSKTLDSDHILIGEWYS